jgi:hypothetical protein
MSPLTIVLKWHMEYASLNICTCICKYVTLYQFAPILIIIVDF